MLSLDGLMNGVRSLQVTAWAPFVFVLVYVTTTALGLPGSVVTIVGGVVFGFGWGALYNSIGANIGANAAFGLARMLGRDGVERIVGKRIQRLNNAMLRHGLIGLLALRLIPLVPFNALNFGSGLTRLRWREYIIATMVGILPGTLVYTFFADALVGGSMEASPAATVRVWIAGAMLLVLSLLPFIARRLGFKLNGRASSGVLP
jgi:uncharacterized membrane protein YdjX (TVP38/TMEM64 family)